MKHISKLKHWILSEFSLRFFISLGIIVVVKLFFSAFAPFKIDMDAWIAWGGRLLAVGPSEFYNTSAWTAYLPGYLYFLWFIAFIQVTFFDGIAQSGLEFLYKLFPIVFDLANGILIYLAVNSLQKKHFNQAKESVAIAVSILYLLLPFTTINASIWGQADSVHTFFMLLSFYILSRNKIYTSALLFSLAVCIKPQALFMAPAYIFYTINSYSLTKNLIGLVIFIVSSIAIVFPFYGTNFISGIQSVLDANNLAYGYNSLNTFNFWGVYGFWIPDSTHFMYNLTMKQAGMYLASLFGVIGLLYYVYFVHVKKLAYTFPVASLFAGYFIFTVIMFITQMHERYMYPLFAFFAVFGGYFWLMSKQKYRATRIGLLAYFVLLGILHGINLYYVYLYYMYFQVGVPLENTFYHFVSNNIQIWSYIMIVFYMLFVINMPILLGKMLKYEKHT